MADELTQRLDDAINDLAAGRIDGVLSRGTPSQEQASGRIADVVSRVYALDADGDRTVTPSELRPVFDGLPSGVRARIDQACETLDGRPRGEARLEDAVNHQIDRVNGAVEAVQTNQPEYFEPVLPPADTANGQTARDLLSGALESTEVHHSFETPIVIEHVAFDDICAAPATPVVAPTSSQPKR